MRSGKGSMKLENVIMFWCGKVVMVRIVEKWRRMGGGGFWINEV
jgi:hypothetical protein